MTAQQASKGVLKAMRPTYFLQTKEGAYSGMIKHNLLNSTRSSIGASLSFTDLVLHAPKLAKYSQQTGKQPLSYFNLIGEHDYPQSANAARKLTLLTPFPS